jgi:uncharacterized membrane protein (DUF106 family)
MSTDITRLEELENRINELQEDYFELMKRLTDLLEWVNTVAAVVVGLYSRLSTQEKVE